ncbi:MAG TPA: DNA-binding response regulator [Microbacterium sp.]|jgi:DNA-binding NarL/FixJ family response regulator|uniref:response regulator n=1 Tax=unclassified Microbacterium TaxID=2609290 RepID=UPI000C60B53A|nr:MULTISPECIES: response regulator transcription factor [unclassified Microbacterium]MBU19386.1 DNA-binding response regulator [Microbacterium sp.]RCL88107.1 MAG: DNA-binding response regulator [Microbacterium sp.]HBS09604.1 DNA-binding response regulator [Microbacterium sp.]|tara:strand:- start:977 stop:1681 length:705 start_codon:yes stop_codon:yes gene_type:complete
MTVKQIRVLIADDNRAYRKGVRIRLEHAPGIAVIGEVSNGVDAVMAARSERASVVLMDLNMPGGGGLEATRALAGPGVDRPVAVVVVTSHEADRFVIEALDSGAVGYLVKNHDTTQLVEAVRSAASGTALVSTRVTPAVIREFTRRGEQSAMGSASPAILTSAQLAVARELSRGHTSNEALAARLGVSINTVRAQLHSALKRTQLADRTQLALWAVRHGLDRTETSSDRMNSEK